MSDEEVEICTQDVEKCVNEMVKAILILDHSKKPFKQTDIWKFLSQKPYRKQWNAAFEICKNRLKELGLTLAECKNSNGKSFILVSNNFPLHSMYRHADDSEVADRTLLILILAYIFMKEGTVTDAEVLSHLHELHIYSERNPVHDYFGDVKKKISRDFVNQLYLEKIPIPDCENSELKWGERASAEVSKRLILNFVCEIGYDGAIEPKKLASHYRHVLQEEKGCSSESTNSEGMEIDE